jgi:endoglucanase
MRTKWMERALPLFLMPALACTAAHAQSGFVHTDGKYLVTPAGQRLLLRGTNLANWLEPEGYMFLLDGGPASPREIETFFSELIGPADAAKFWREYRDEYITQRDINFLRKAGFNSVRIPIHYKFFVSGGEGFALLDRLIGWCREAGLWVILDLHCAPGGQTGTNIDDSFGYPWLFESAADRDLTVDVWKRLAEHCHDEPAILGYDLLNEPIPHFPKLQKYNDMLESLYKRITSAMRSVDNNHVIILGGAQWDSNFKVFGAPFDRNVMYSFHKYWTAPNREVIQEYLDFRDRYNVPIWLGESGENTDEWIAQFVRVLEKNDVGWCFWPYKKMQKTSAVVSFAPPAHWAEILAYAKIPANTGETEKRIAARPSLEDSREALRDLLRKIRFENCSVNSGYLKALGLNEPLIR